MAQAMSSTMTDTPPIHVATFATLDALGPRSDRIDPIDGAWARDAVRRRAGLLDALRLDALDGTRS